MTGPKRRALSAPVDIAAIASRAARLLREAKVEDFALIGGGAVRAFGLERTTKDVDFAVREAAIPAVLEYFQGDVRQLGIGGVSLTFDDGAVVDLVDRRRDLAPLFGEALDATRLAGSEVVAGGEQIPVVPAEYLVAMKLAAGRAQDEADIAWLLRQPEIDYSLARDVTKRHLGFFAAKYLDRLARLAGRTDLGPDYEAETSDA